nr:DUF397 domain-containing protein [Streptomyces spongiae]
MPETELLTRNAEHVIPDASTLQAWRKSTYSGGSGGGCLEVSDGHPAGVPVRDSKAPKGPAPVRTSKACAGVLLRTSSAVGDEKLDASDCWTYARIHRWVVEWMACHHLRRPGSPPHWAPHTRRCAPRCRAVDPSDSRCAGRRPGPRWRDFESAL